MRAVKRGSLGLGGGNPPIFRGLLMIAAADGAVVAGGWREEILKQNCKKGFDGLGCWA